MKDRKNLNIPKVVYWYNLSKM